MFKFFTNIIDSLFEIIRIKTYLKNFYLNKLLNNKIN